MDAIQNSSRPEGREALSSWLVRQVIMKNQLEVTSNWLIVSEDFYRMICRLHGTEEVKALEVTIEKYDY